MCDDRMEAFFPVVLVSTKIGRGKATGILPFFCGSDAVSAFFSCKPKIMGFRIVVILTVVVGFFSCQKAKERQENPRGIAVRPTDKALSLDALFSDWQAMGIPEIDPVSPVYRIVSDWDQGMYLLDGSRSRIYRLDQGGACRVILDSGGEGPGEYLEIWAFRVFPESGDLLVLDRKSSKLLRYSAQSGFLGEYPLKKENSRHLLGFEIIGEDEVVFHTDGTSGYHLMRLSLRDGEFGFFEPVDPLFGGFSYGNDKSFTASRQGFSMIHSLGNTIGRFGPGFGPMGDIKLDLGNQEITKSELEVLKNDQIRMLDLILDDDRRKAHSFWLEETENFYLLTVLVGSFQNGGFFKSIIDKRSWRSRSFRTFRVGDMDLDLMPVGRLSDDRLVFRLNHEQLESSGLEKSLSGVLAVDSASESTVLIIGKLREIP